MEAFVAALRNSRWKANRSSSGSRERYDPLSAARSTHDGRALHHINARQSAPSYRISGHQSRSTGSTLSAGESRVHAGAGFCRGFRASVEISPVTSHGLSVVAGLERPEGLETRVPDCRNCRCRRERTASAGPDSLGSPQQHLPGPARLPELVLVVGCEQTEAGGRHPAHQRRAPGEEVRIVVQFEEFCDPRQRGCR